MSHLQVPCGGALEHVAKPVNRRQTAELTPIGRTVHLSAISLRHTQKSIGQIRVDKRRSQSIKQGRARDCCGRLILTRIYIRDYTISICSSSNRKYEMSAVPCRCRGGSLPTPTSHRSTFASLTLSILHNYYLIKMFLYIYVLYIIYERTLSVQRRQMIAAPTVTTCDTHL